MKVYRIERKEDGKGVYTAGYGADHVTHSEQPSPRDDFYQFPRSCYYYGFKSVEQMHNWFFDPSWYDHIATHEFILRVYETKWLLKGNYQVAFIKYEAHLVEEISLYDVLPNPTQEQMERLQARREWIKQQEEDEKEYIANKRRMSYEN